MLESLKAKISRSKESPESVLSALYDIREYVKSGIRTFFEDLSSMGEAGFDFVEEKSATPPDKFSIN